jgi:phosphatidate cytidylyltransferase
MFKQRLLTALILVPLVLLVLYFGPAWILAGILLVIVSLCGWEWARLIPLKKSEYRMLYIIVLLLATWLVSANLPSLLSVGLNCWLLILLAVLTYPGSQNFWGYRSVVGIVGLLLLSLFANVFVALYHSQHGQNLIVYIFCLVWAADTGAYLVGKQWGRHKLIPEVSPGKTIEGTMGGLILAFLVTLVGFWALQPVSKELWFVMSMLTVLISILGDLLISLLKRRCHLKDSGSILPGHGGILDRLDSSIAAFPLFYLALSWLELGR